MSECKVVLDDVLLTRQTVKSKMLNGSRDKTHSAPSRRQLEQHYLDGISQRSQIAWPNMKESDKWEELDDSVYNLLIGASSIQDRVSLLEDTIYSKASLLFGFIHQRKKGLRGLNRRAQYSIQLVKEKNTLQNQLKSCDNEVSFSSLQLLLDNVRLRLRRLRKGEKNRKKRWKIKQANKDFLNNPYEAGKKVLDPESKIFLKCDKEDLDSYKSFTLKDENYKGF